MLNRAASSGSQSAPIVFVVDDDVSIRESLQGLISTEGMRVKVFASAEEFLAHPRVSGPSCLVLDVSLPALDGLDLQQLMAADRGDMPIIFITAHGDIPMTVKAMKGGALEFFPKPFDVDVLLAAIRSAIARSSAMLESESYERKLREDYASLSPREREVMTLVVAGRLNKQVAGELGISEITVKLHRANIMRKMKANSLADLVNMASRLRSNNRA